jgi:hypothetical protein
MMAAGTAAHSGNKVVLLEKMPLLGRKLLITGQGRCNVTNDLETKQFIADCGPGGRFLHGCLNRFSQADTLEFFRGLGVELVLERGGRYFPSSQRSAEILGALQRFMAERGVKTITNARVTSITRDRAGFAVSFSNMTSHADSVIIATGGRSYPATGSTGDGYEWARLLGHTVKTQRPSDVPMESGDAFVKRLQGLSLKNVGLNFRQDRKKAEYFGEMLFTHYGISGPIVLDASREVGDWLDEGPVQCSLDLKPALDEETLDNRLLREIETHGRKQFRALLRELMPSSLVPEFAGLSHIPAEVPLNQLGRQQRAGVRLLLKDIRFNITGLRGFDEAVVTAGGVDLNEIDPRTMESKIAKGLYFAGEVMDLDGPCGGYNLQIAWSTGHQAGKSAGSLR